MNPIILKYCGILSTRVDRYVVKSQRPYKANFRCPVCGDSAKSKTKARGWIIEHPKTDSTSYFCHNCNYSNSFSGFLDRVDHNVFEEFIGEYKLDKLRHSGRIKTDVEMFADKMKPPKFHNDPVTKVFSSIKKISQLSHDHPAKEYVVSRQIPPEHHSRLYYCPKFKAFTNLLVPGKFENITQDNPRLIIPFINKKGDLFGYTGRAFGHDDKRRYITIIIDDTQPKLFGMDRCDQSKLHILVEGPLDSMFLDNAIAIAGGGTSFEGCNKNTVVCYDNEPRSKDTIARMLVAIEKGYKVVIWPDSITDKDINLMVLNNPGIRINELVYNNIYEGLSARMKLNAWRKV